MCSSDLRDECGEMSTLRGEMNDIVMQMISIALQFLYRFRVFILSTESLSQGMTLRLSYRSLPVQPPNSFVPSRHARTNGSHFNPLNASSIPVIVASMTEHSSLDLVLYNTICHLLELLRPIIQFPEACLPMPFVTGTF